MTNRNSITNRNLANGKLDLWAKVIIAKNMQADEPIFGAFDECCNPVPGTLNVTLADGETVECIRNFKIIFNQDSVTEQFICANKVILSIPFTAYFWIKTNLGFVNSSMTFTFTKEIPVCRFVKQDGTPLTACEFREFVEQSFVVVCDYEIAYINILPKTTPTIQTIQIILTATVADKLGKYQDVLVYGDKEDFGCIVDCCD
ncbi:MAG TPA: hypothetical protein VM577_17150 [Anaerovoracaceae bacterium]|nr:hypothetical protein [Anaerovoracaceae bacterium]